MIYDGDINTEALDPIQKGHRSENLIFVEKVRMFRHIQYNNLNILDCPKH